MGPCGYSTGSSHRLLLGRRLAEKPFALLGANCDATAGDARRVAAGQSITWPIIHDGLHDEGKIAERYRVASHGIPAIFVIDRQGVLRHEYVLSAAALGRFPICPVRLET